MILSLRSTEEEDHEDEEVIKENGGTRVSKTRVLTGINQIMYLEFLKLKFSHGSRVLKTREASFPVCFATGQLMILLEN